MNNRGPPSLDTPCSSQDENVALPDRNNKQRHSSAPQANTPRNKTKFTSVADRIAHFHTKSNGDGFENKINNNNNNNVITTPPPLPRNNNNQQTPPKQQNNRKPPPHIRKHKASAPPPVSIRKQYDNEINDNFNSNKFPVPRTRSNGQNLQFPLPPVDPAPTPESKKKKPKRKGFTLGSQGRELDIKTVPSAHYKHSAPLPSHYSSSQRDHANTLPTRPKFEKPQSIPCITQPQSPTHNTTNTLSPIPIIQKLPKKSRKSISNQSVKQYIVIKEKTLQFSENERCLDITHWGSVLVRKTRYGDVTFEVPDLAFFSPVDGSDTKVSLNWEQIGTRVYRFKDQLQRTEFLYLKYKTNFTDNRAPQNYTKKFFGKDDYYHREINLQQRIAVTCQRTGSKICHRGWVYFTNFRILMVNQLDIPSEERRDNIPLRRGLPYVPAVSVPWFLIDDIEEAPGSNVIVKCKDLRTITYILPEGRGPTFFATLSTYSNPQSPMHVYAYSFYEELVQGPVKILDESSITRHIRSIDDLKKDVEWHSQSDELFEHIFHYNPSQVERIDAFNPHAPLVLEFYGLVLEAIGETSVIVKDQLANCKLNKDLRGWSILRINCDDVKHWNSEHIIDVLQEIEHDVEIDFQKIGIGDQYFEQLRQIRQPLDVRDKIMEKEYERLLGESKAFRISKVNRNYEVCPSYPPIIMCPTKVDNTMLYEDAKFRSSGRIPGIVWISKSGNIAMARSSQPNAGLGVMRSRSVVDEQYLDIIRECNEINPNRLLIIDCRPSLNAHANKLKGKGFESDQDYENCHLDFYDIENIHKMRDSLQRVKDVVETNDDNWLTRLEGTKWLYHIKQVLACALRVVTAIRDDHNSVLVHCSDGWDRTSQVCALGQLLLDPYYRTFEGFLVLIQKEWLWYGHMFATRCGLYTDDGLMQKKSQRSPVFLQFLDSVYQISIQFPGSLEFNELLLLHIAEDFQSGRFGDFFGHHEKEREEMGLWIKTDCLWTHLKHIWYAEDNNVYRNSMYINSKEVLRPKANMKDVRLWNNYYSRFSEEDEDSWEVLKKHNEHLNHMYFVSPQNETNQISMRMPMKTPEASHAQDSQFAGSWNSVSPDNSPHNSSSRSRPPPRPRNLASITKKPPPPRRKKAMARPVPPPPEHNNSYEYDI